MKCALILLAVYLVSICAAQHVSFTQTSANYGCYNMNPYSCYSCYNGYGYNYYFMYEQSGQYYYLNGTDSSVCYTYSGGILIKQGNCAGSVYCTISYEVSYRFDSLYVSTTAPPMKVTLFPGEDGEVNFGKVTSENVSIHGPIIQQLFFHSANGERLHFIKKLSSSEYVTNYGIYSIGQAIYNSGFTFTYESYQSSTPPSNPPMPPSAPDFSVAAYFYPFFQVEVTDTSKTMSFAQDEGALAFFGNDAQSDFQGMNIYNPLLGIRNVALYPPYGGNYYHGTIVFQTVESSDYHAAPVEYDYGSGSIGSGSIAVYDFELSLDLSDLGSVFGWSGFSLSLDELEYKPKPAHASADAMAFDLF